MTAAIEVRSVTRTYGRTTALNEASFVVPEGSITGLLGRNGAGKTTIMSIIAGQDRPSSGEVLVNGHTPFEHAPTLAQISYVRDNQRYPDNYRLPHVLRIAPHFAANWSDDLAAELVDRFAIPSNTRISKLSRGQLSAVAIVLGLASRAPVTLLDEPYLGLDVTARGLFYEILLRDLAEHPRSVLLSTHLVDEAENLFDRVVVLDQGAVVLDRERDQTHELAFMLSGAARAVEQVIAGRTVIAMQAVGGLRSATIEGPVDEDTRSFARELGVEVAAASLHDLVAAYGRSSDVLRPGGGPGHLDPSKEHR